MKMPIPNPSGHRLRFSSFLGMAALSLAIAGCGQKEAAKPPAPPPQEVGVVTIQPEKADIVTELPGRTASFRVAEVRPQVSGVVLQRLFVEGSDVKAGQQLYQIDPATYQATAASQEAAVAKAKAAAEVARLLAVRRQKLVQDKVISQQDYDDASASYQQAQADTGAAEAALKTAQIDLVYTKVLSPISGRIGRSAVTEGALVTANQSTPLSTVQQLDPIYVDVVQSSAQLLKLQSDLEAGHLTNSADQTATTQLILEDGTTYPQVGKLQFSEVTVDEGTGSVTLRAEFPNPRKQLLPGMFVRALIKEGENPTALLVPQKGVTRNPRGEPVAMVVGEGDKIESRVLKTDRVIGDRWLVTDGIKAGDRVVLEGLQKIRPGAVVKPVEIEKVGPAAAPAK
jgi:membrane fusion protein (multidrug efflux system)